MLLLVPCSDSAPTTAGPMSTALHASEAPPSNQVGQTSVPTVSGTDQFGATIAPGNVVWSSTAAASISQTGVVTGVSAGSATIVATAGAISAQTTVTVTALPATKLLVNAAPADAVPVRTVFALQPTVQLADVNGAAVQQAGVVVTASLTGVGGLTGTATAVTDASGIAKFTNLGVNGAVGIKAITFTANGLTSAVWTLTLRAGPAANITINVGNNQSATAGTQVAIDPAVRVTDVDGNPVPGRAVNFAVTADGGSLPGGAPAVTDANGFAHVSWRLGSSLGVNTLSAIAAGVGATVVFTAIAALP